MRKLSSPYYTIVRLLLQIFASYSIFAWSMQSGEPQLCGSSEQKSALTPTPAVFFTALRARPFFRVPRFWVVAHCQEYVKTHRH